MYEYFDLDFEKAEFEWDENKEAENFRKHGIHFITAIKVFKDENKIIRYDEEHTSEERYDVLGKVGNILFVVCTFRSQNIIRIISARKASNEEKRRYQYGESEDE